MWTRALICIFLVVWAWLVLIHLPGPRVKRDFDEREH